MNYLIKISHECTWQEIEARVTFDLEDMLGQALVKHSLLNENKNTSVWLAEIADYNKNDITILSDFALEVIWEVLGHHMAQNIDF